MAQKAYAYGITGIDFISYNDLFQNYINNKEDKILIDEIENLVQNYTRGNLIGYTLTNED
jgi:hypothetical protein